jgi:hypothetical protein
MRDQISITLNKSDIQKRLKGVFLKEHAEMMSECLMDMFKDRETDLEVLFKASMGLIPELEYNKGDEVLVKIGHISLYYADKEKCIAGGYIKDDLIKSKITAISKYAASPYMIKYYYINKDTGKEDYTTYDISETSITGFAEVFPGDEEV